MAASLFGGSNNKRKLEEFLDTKAITDNVIKGNGVDQVVDEEKLRDKYKQSIDAKPLGEEKRGSNQKNLKDVQPLGGIRDTSYERENNENLNHKDPEDSGNESINPDFDEIFGTNDNLDLDVSQNIFDSAMVSKDEEEISYEDKSEALFSEKMESIARDDKFWDNIGEFDEEIKSYQSLQLEKKEDKLEPIKSVETLEEQKQAESNRSTEPHDFSDPLEYLEEDIEGAESPKYEDELEQTEKQFAPRDWDEKPDVVRRPAPIQTPKEKVLKKQAESNGSTEPHDFSDPLEYLEEDIEGAESPKCEDELEQTEKQFSPMDWDEKPDVVRRPAPIQTPKEKVLKKQAESNGSTQTHDFSDPIEYLEEDIEGAESPKYEQELEQTEKQFAPKAWDDKPDVAPGPPHIETPKEKILLKQLILVATISAILGGTIVGILFILIMPNASKNVPGVNQNTNMVLDGQGGKKIIIQNGESPYAAIAEKCGPSVVGIQVNLPKISIWPFGDVKNNPQGSGIIIRQDGYIVTNNHVIDEAMLMSSNRVGKGVKIIVVLPSQKDKPYEATLVGRDIRTDLAVLKIEAKGLPAIEMGNSDIVRVGDIAVAIGNPGGLEYMGSVTTGIISGLNRTIPMEDGKELKLLQTDAAINPGNSGGALVNSKGQLIGINTAKIGGSGYEGLGFAIPVNKAKEITNSLIEYKYVKGRPMLGITSNPDYSEAYAVENDLPVGVLIEEVSPLSGAYAAKLMRGDIITKVGGIAVKTVDDINNIKEKMKPGDKIKIEYYRDKKNRTTDVKLTEDKR